MKYLSWQGDYVISVRNVHSNSKHNCPINIVWVANKIIRFVCHYDAKGANSKGYLYFEIDFLFTLLHIGRLETYTKNALKKQWVN